MVPAVEPADSARVSILLADFANTDSDGKLNIVGGGLQFIGYDPYANTTLPFAVVATVSFGHECAHSSPSIELQLEDHEGQLVTIPGPTGHDGPLVRVGKSDPLAAVSYPTAPEFQTAPLDPSVKIVLGFSTGLPLPSGRVYTWRVMIDAQRREEWATRFFVPGIQSPPAIG